MRKKFLLYKSVKLKRRPVSYKFAESINQFFSHAPRCYTRLPITTDYMLARFIMLIYYDNRRPVSCGMHVESLVFKSRLSSRFASHFHTSLRATSSLFVPLAARSNMLSEYRRQIVMGNSPTEFPTG